MLPVVAPSASARSNDVEMQGPSGVNPIAASFPSADTDTDAARAGKRQRRDVEICENSSTSTRGRVFVIRDGGNLPAELVAQIAEHVRRERFDAISTNFPSDLGPNPTVHFAKRTAEVKSTNSLANYPYIPLQLKVLGLVVNFFQTVALALLIYESEDHGAARSIARADKVLFLLIYYPIICFLLCGTLVSELSDTTAQFYRGDFIVAPAAAGSHSRSWVASCFDACLPNPLCLLLLLPRALYTYFTGVIDNEHANSWSFSWHDRRMWTVCQDVVMLALLLVSSVLIVSAQREFLGMLYNFAGVLVVQSLDDVVAAMLKLTCTTLQITVNDGRTRNAEEDGRGGGDRAPCRLTSDVRLYYLGVTLAVSYASLVLLLKE